MLSVTEKKKVGGVLLLFHCPIAATPPFIQEHIDSFKMYSKFEVWAVNTELGFPGGLEYFDFQVIVFSYTLFAANPFYLGRDFLEYVQSSQAYKIAFFQDEYRFWPERSGFINSCRIDCVYTCLEPAYFNQTYRSRTSAGRIRQYLPGYVSSRQVKEGLRHVAADSDREIDIGYRGRPTFFWMGKGPREKTVIGKKFQVRAADLGLVLDIDAREEKRIYGDDWLKFLGNCRAVLGVEAGVSIFDLDNEMMPQYETIVAERPDITFEEISELLLDRYEDKGVYYRTVSPRVFEAASVRTCQILFEGRYSGIILPNVHYIPLKKDLSNFDEVIRQFRDPGVRQLLTDNAYRDLIESGAYSYEAFIKEFDQDLLEFGVLPEDNLPETKNVVGLLIYEYEYRRVLEIAEIGEEKYRDTLRQYVGLQYQYMDQQQQLADLMGHHVSLQQDYVSLQQDYMDQQQQLTNLIRRSMTPWRQFFYLRYCIFRGAGLRGLRKMKSVLLNRLGGLRRKIKAILDTDK